MEKLYTLKEAKKLLGVTTKTVQRWDKEGRLVGEGEYLKAKSSAFLD